VQRRETRADAEGALAEPAGGRRKDRAYRVVLLDEILQAKQVRESRRESLTSTRKVNAIRQRVGSPLEPPRAIALGVLQQGPRPRLGVKKTPRIGPQPLTGDQRGAQRRPIEAKVGAHARVGRDAQVVFEQEPVDGAHGWADERRSASRAD